MNATRRLLVRNDVAEQAESTIALARNSSQPGYLLDEERSLLEFRVEELTMRMERESAWSEISLVILGARSLSGS